MSDIITRALFSGLGLASLTKDAIAETARELVNRSNLSEAEGRKVVKELHRRSVEAQKALDEKIEAAVHRVLKTLDLPELNARLRHPSKPGGKKPAKGAARGGRRKAKTR